MPCCAVTQFGALPRGFTLLVLALSLAFLAGCPQNNNINGNGDSDGDGFTDEAERSAFPGSDPFNAADTPVDPLDTDGDRCSDFDEVEFGLCNADPDVAGGLDSDGDGFPDDVETLGIPGTDPNDPTDTPDSPRDTDGDGCSDFDETEFGFCNGDPLTP